MQLAGTDHLQKDVTGPVEGGVEDELQNASQQEFADELAEGHGITGSVSASLLLAKKGREIEVLAIDHIGVFAFEAAAW